MHRTVCSGKSLTSQQENYEKLMSVLNSSRERKTRRQPDKGGQQQQQTPGDSNNTQQDTRITGTHTQQIDLSISVYVLNWKSSADTNGCD